MTGITPGNQGIPSFYRIDPSGSSGTKKTEGTLGSRVVTVRTTDSKISHTMIEKALETASTKFTDETYLREVTVLRESNKNSITVTFTSSLGNIKKIECPITGSAAKDHPTVRDLEQPVRDLEQLFRGKTWGSKFAEDVAALHPKGNVAFRLTVALQTLLFPLAGLGYLFFAVGHAIHTAKNNSVANNPLALFVDGLREMNVVMKALASRSPLTELDRAIALCEAIQKAHSGEGTPEAFIQDLTPKLESATEDNPVIFPTGSFFKGEFVPALLMIFKNEPRKTYTVKEISLPQKGSTGKEISLPQKGSTGKLESAGSYTFSDLRHLNFFISLAIQNSNPINNGQSTLNEILKKCVESKLCTENLQSQDDLIPSGTPTNTDPIGLLTACGNRVHQLEEHISSLQQDLLSLEHTLYSLPDSAIYRQHIKNEIRTAQNELLELTDGTPESVHHYLNVTIQLILTKIRNLSPQDRSAYVADIKNNTEALEQQLTLAYGSPIANAFITTLDENIKIIAPILEASSSTTHQEIIAPSSLLQNEHSEAANARVGEPPLPTVNPSSADSTSSPPRQAPIAPPISTSPPPPPRDATTSASLPEQTEIISGPSPNIPSPMQASPTEAGDPASSLTIKSIMDFFKSLEVWPYLKRSGINMALSVYKIELDLDKVRKAFIAANFTEEEFTLFKGTPPFQNLVSIYTQYKKGMLTKEQAIAQFKEFIPRIQQYIDNGNFRPYYTKLTEKK